MAELVADQPLATIPGLAEKRPLPVVAAANEEDSVARVIDELRAFDPGFDVVVVDDGSVDRTAAIAREKGAYVLRLPFNLGIGGAMQTGFRFAFERNYDLAVQIDGDGQHDPQELPKILGPLCADEADIVVGSRFTGDGAFRSSFTRRIGIRLFAWIVSLIVRQKVTDTTSGFRAVN